LLELPCDIGGAADVQQFVRHIWGVELRWAQRLAGLPVMPKEEKVSGQLEALFEFHLKAVEIFRELLTAPDQSWEEDFALDFKWIPPEARVVSSAIGLSWPRWFAPPGSRQGSKATCSSVLRYARNRNRRLPLQGILSLHHLRGRPLLFEADSAQHRPALGGLEGDCSLLTALGTPSPGFRTYPGAAAGALCLALLAALGVVLEVFVVEE